MSKLADYAQFTKFRLAALVVFSAIISYVIACRDLHISINWLELGMLTLGGFLVTGSSNGFNQIIEREYDKLMPRTANRPIPQGRMSVNEGMILSAIMGISGVLILGFFTNWLSGILGAIALVLYVAAYTPLKRVTPFAVLVGAFPGAVPAMLGWVAATEGFGTVGTSALVLFAVQFMWQFPHFWAIAWVADEDYRKAGFFMLPSPGGRDKSSAFQVLVYTLVLIPVSLTPLMFRVSGIYSAIVILAAGGFFLYQAWTLYRNCDVPSARKLMFGSFLYLPVVQLAMMTGY
ncbi:MAG: heme o synthase [Bacteroidia bacterium]